MDLRFEFRIGRGAARLSVLEEVVEFVLALARAFNSHAWGLFDQAHQTIADQVNPVVTVEVFDWPYKKLLRKSQVETDNDIGDCDQ